MPDADQASRDSSNWVWDPVFLHARREAWAILLFWLVALAWCVPVSYVLGYRHADQPVVRTTVLGIPAWLFWGVVLPWVASIIASTWFCFRVMKDDPLDVDNARLADDDAPGTEQRGPA